MAGLGAIVGVLRFVSCDGLEVMDCCVVFE